MSAVNGWRFLALFTVALQGAMLGQSQDDVSKAETKFYKLDFVVKEVDGTKVSNSRSYSVIAATGGPGCSIRTGSKVPVPSYPNSTSFQYTDVGVDIDCRNMKEEPRSELSLLVIADITSTVQDPAMSGSQPIIVRHNRWNSTVLLPVKRTALIYASDDTTTKRQMQLELTATPLQ